MAEDEDANYNLKSGEERDWPEKEGLYSYSKYAVGGKSTEVPASALDENDILVIEENRMSQNK